MIEETNLCYTLLVLSVATDTISCHTEFQKYLKNQCNVVTSLRNRNIPEYVGLVRIKVNNSTLIAFLLLVRLVGSTNLETAA